MATATATDEVTPIFDAVTEWWRREQAAQHDTQPLTIPQQHLPETDSGAIYHENSETDTETATDDAADAPTEEDSPDLAVAAVGTIDPTPGGSGSHD